MNILVANSRGAGLRELIPNSIVQKVLYRPGARVSSLGHLAANTNVSLNSPSESHVYILAGIPDITTKLKGEKYEEVVFLDQPETATSKILDTIISTKSLLEKAKIKPIFCTISSMHIEKWNQTRLRQNKTTKLCYTSQYTQMQNNLNITLDAVNYKIIELNKNSGMHTPMTHKVIKHPKGKGKHNYKYNLLVDGVHGDQKAKAQWAKGIIQAIKKNRSEDSEEELEEKRSWRKERHE